MIKLRKLRVAVTAVTIFAFLAMVGTVFASNDNYGFSFKLKAGYQNSYSEKRYRQTTNEDNKWKVNMKYNSEGDGCKATFWLAKSDENRTVVSNTHTIKQGSGAHYYKATAGASKTNVRLGAENNNDAACTISGFWDEETK
ncbi:DUF2712 domain-containing protein [Hornefia butyriciproducens]|uniref:DUF2712 domain-containing protein n=1 Tax=Hornefia butyriciproducens TaxID=2652293 RepID=UPI003F88B00E